MRKVDEARTKLEETEPAKGLALRRAPRTFGLGIAKIVEQKDLPSLRQIIAEIVL